MLSMHNSDNMRFDHEQTSIFVKFVYRGVKSYDLFGLNQNKIGRFFIAIIS